MWYLDTLCAFVPCMEIVSYGVLCYKYVLTIYIYRVQPMMFDGPLGIMMPASEDGAMPPVFFVNINQLYSKYVYYIYIYIYI